MAGHAWRVALTSPGETLDGFGFSDVVKVLVIWFVSHSR